MPCDSDRRFSFRDLEGLLRRCFLRGILSENLSVQFRVSHELAIQDREIKEHPIARPAFVEVQSEALFDFIDSIQDGISMHVELLCNGGRFAFVMNVRCENASIVTAGCDVLCNDLL